MENNNNEVKETKKSFFSKLNLVQKIIYVLGVIMVISLVFYLINGGGNSAVNIVKNGELNDYQGITIGKAFDNFFSNPQWKSSETKDKKTIVNFKGEASLGDKPVTISINFQVNKDSKSFNVINLYMDGKIQPDYELIDWLDTIFE